MRMGGAAMDGIVHRGRTWSRATSGADRRLDWRRRLLLRERGRPFRIALERRALSRGLVIDSGRGRYGVIGLGAKGMVESGARMGERDWRRRSFAVGAGMGRDKALVSGGARGLD